MTTGDGIDDAAARARRVLDEAEAERVRLLAEARAADLEIARREAAARDAEEDPS